MYELALGLSIISSILVIIYLVGLIFAKRQNNENQTITIAGRIITTTFTAADHSQNARGDNMAGVRQKPRVVDGEVVDAKQLLSQVQHILNNVK
jgi:hypothetical protein